MHENETSVSKMSEIHRIFSMKKYENNTMRCNANSSELNLHKTNDLDIHGKPKQNMIIRFIIQVCRLDSTFHNSINQ